MSYVQKIKAPLHLACLKEDDQEGSYSSNFRLPILQRKKSWKDVPNVPLSSNKNSSATSVSWTDDINVIETPKFVQEWNVIEKTLYEENGKLSEGPVYDECLQWKTQIPYLRLVGKNLLGDGTMKMPDSVASTNLARHFNDNNETKINTSHGLSAKKDKTDSSRHTSHNRADQYVIETLLDLMFHRLFLDKDFNVEGIAKAMCQMVTIIPDSVGKNKSITKDCSIKSKEECYDNSLGNRYSSAKTRLWDTQDLPHVKDSQRSRSMLSNKRRDLKDLSDINMVEMNQQMDLKQYSRNKLGTVFNERIVVSPVPFIVSSRKSFSTLRTTPIKFVGERPEVSSKTGSKGMISGEKTPIKKSNTMSMYNINSGWPAPVCSSTAWPKNVKLTPIDASQLPSNKNRTLSSSPSTTHRNRKPLSPILRSTLSVTANLPRDNDKESLEVQGKRIVAEQSAKQSLRTSAWNNSPRNVKNKKKSQGKLEDL